MQSFVIAVNVELSANLYKERAMSSHQKNPSWEDRYQAKITKWDRGGTSPNLMQWLDSGVLSPCRIMLPGCGNGYEAITLAEQGFEVVCVDIAATPIANLRKALAERNLTAELIESDFFSLDFSTQAFDAIYEQTCLCALQPSEWGSFESWMHQSLKMGGKLYAQFMQTGEEGGPPFHCDMGEMRNLFSDKKWLWKKENKAQNMSSLSKKMEIPCLLVKV